MKAFLALCIVGIAFGSVANADVVEEETWYNAKGEIVKTVKRTLTGAEARDEPDWEPAWIRRERARRAGRVSYVTPRRYWRTSCYPRTWTAFYPFTPRYYYPRTYFRGTGLRGYLRIGAGKTRWGLGYRAGGLKVRITR